MIVGICGPAGCGKDTFYKIAKGLLENKGLTPRRLAFADELKEECYDFLIENTGISSFTQCPEEKEIIRPFLVTYGTHVRRKLDKNCWIDKIKKITLDLDEKNVIVFITDARYLNELEWVHSAGGKCIFISRSGIPDANDEERANNKALINLCDHRVLWPTVEESEITSLAPIVQSTIKLLLPCQPPTTKSSSATKNLSQVSKTTKMLPKI